MGVILYIQKEQNDNVYTVRGVSNFIDHGPKIANQIVHINASPEFLNDEQKMQFLFQMCEIADRKTTNKTIIETHYY